MLKDSYVCVELDHVMQWVRGK